MNRLRSVTYREDLSLVCRDISGWEKLQGARILITGATGLIGSFLVDTLMYLKEEKKINLQLDILCRSRESAQALFEDYAEDEEFTIFAGDLTKSFTLHREYDYIIHGAGNNHPVAFAKEPVETMKTALLGTVSLLDSLTTQQKQGKFLLLSTGEVYGKSPVLNETDKQEVTGVQNGMGIESEMMRSLADREAESRRMKGSAEEEIGVSDPMNPRSCYPEAKRAAETLCVSYTREYGIHTNVARLSYIYGATFQTSSTKADVQFLQKAIGGEDIVMKSAGTQLRSYCYLADAARGIFTILLQGASGEAYNVANPDSQVTIRKFAHTLAELAGVRILFENPDDVECRGYSTLSRELLDASKLEALGFRPQVGLREALERILKISAEQADI